MFFPFYEEEIIVDGVKQRKFYSPDLYFATTNSSVFESSYLAEVEQLVTLCNAQFRHITTVYNEDKGDQLDYRTLEDGFFSYIIGKMIIN